MLRQTVGLFCVGYPLKFLRWLREGYEEALGALRLETRIIAGKEVLVDADDVAG